MKSLRKDRLITKFVYFLFSFFISFLIVFNSEIYSNIYITLRFYGI